MYQLYGDKHCHNVFDLLLFSNLVWSTCILYIVNQDIDAFPANCKIIHDMNLFKTPRRISDDCCYRSNETCMKNTSGSRRNRLTFCCLLLVSYCNIRSLKKICYIFDEARLDLYCGAWKRGITPICRCETIFKLPIFITFSAMKATKKLNLNLRFVCS